jgi:hypothetical protein
MAAPNDPWWIQAELWVEAFTMVNIAFLTFDIYLAHSINQFRNPAEYIPLMFSATAPPILVLGLSQRRRHRTLWKILGRGVGWAAIVVGLTGVIRILKAASFTSARSKA